MYCLSVSHKTSKGVVRKKLAFPDEQKKTFLEELDEGQILSIKMNDGEPVQNVPRSIKEEGHKILKLIDNEDGTYDLIVEKVGD